MSKREEYERLAEVSEAELCDFDLLDRETQKQIVDGLLALARNPKLPQADRDVARRQAGQYRQRLRRQNR